MKGEKYEKMMPWFKGFTGTVTVQDSNKGYNIHGVFNVLPGNELEITELPIGKWTADYKGFLEGLVKSGDI